MTPNIKTTDGLGISLSSPTPFPELNTILGELVTSLQAALENNLCAVYLQGSFAVGDFDQDSDVDFLAAVTQELSETQLAALQAAHARIYDLGSPWATHLEGSYFPVAALRRYDRAGEALWYLDNCSRTLVRSPHDNTQIVRWVVREYGIPLAGVEANTLIDPVSASDLKSEVRQTMGDWAEEIFSGQYALTNRWSQPFAVISYCRMLHTLQTGTVESKPAGVLWGQATLEKKWAGLIKRAWNERPNPSLKVQQPADPHEVQQTLEFIHFALERVC